MFAAHNAPAAPDALLALGRLDGALAMAQPATLRLFVLRLLRDMLVTALRQEGHAFTDLRFHAWFAGAATLSDEPSHAARPPKALCEAILTELSHSSWDMLADAATRFQAALLAPSDDTGNGLVPQTAHQDAGAVIAAAHTLLAGLAPVADPLTALAQLHHAASRHALFAPAERTSVPIAMGPVATRAIRLTVERMGPPTPRWALELLWGDHWRKTGLLAHALPFPGLVRLDALRADPRTAEPWDADTDDAPSTLLATALRGVAQGLGTSLAETDRLVRRLASCQPGKRRSSRAPALLEVLAGFGPLRSSQLEGLLGVTRLGLRTMLDAVATAGLLDRTTLAGVHLYAIHLDARAHDHGDDLRDLSTFSAATLDEYDAAMADIDALLARSGVTVDEDGDTGEP